MEAGSDIDLATNDLGPLAWVLDELRKSLDSASAALRRFVRDTALARGTDMASGRAPAVRTGGGWTKGSCASHASNSTRPSARWRWSAWARRRTCCARW